MEALSGIPDASVEDIDRFPAASGLTAGTLRWTLSCLPSQFRESEGRSHFQRMAENGRESAGQRVGVEGSASCWASLKRLVSPPGRRCGKLGPGRVGQPGCPMSACQSF